MKGKKFLALIMAAAVSVSALAACGQETAQSGTGDQVKSSQEQGSQTQDAAEQEAGVDVAEEQEPLKFTMSISNGLNEYILQSPDINQDKWIGVFNERYNLDITLKLLDHKRFAEEMQMMFASGDIPDVVKCYDNYTSPSMCQSVENGVFMALDDILATAGEKYPNLMKTIPEAAWDYNKYDGHIYGIPVCYLSRATRRATYIRKDLLDKAGLDIPTTLEDTVEVLKAFRDMGVEYPYAGREYWTYTDIFFGAYGVNPLTWNLNEEGQLVPDMIRPQMKEALAFHKMLKDEGLMDPESLTTNGSDWLNKIYAGKVGMFDHNGGQLYGFNTSLQQNVPDAELILIPSPVGPYGDQGTYKYSPVFESIFINKDFEEPERIFEYLDRMCLEEEQDFLSYGIKGEDWTEENGVISYEYPTDQIGMAEISFRKTLGLVRDDSYDARLTPYQPGGDAFMDWVENVSAYEGIDNIDPGKLESLTLHPELQPGNGCDLFHQMAAAIFYGKADIDSFDDFVEEYLERGGQEIIEEATKAYEEGRTFERK